MSVEEISQYLVREFGLERVPCSVPKNEWNYFKRNIYFEIDNLFKRFKKDKTQYPVYHFFNKLFPVEFLEKRVDKSEYFYHRVDGRVKNEFLLIPDPKNREGVTFEYMNSNTEIFIYKDDYKKKIISVLRNIDEFKYYFREKGLNDLLNEKN